MRVDKLSIPVIAAISMMGVTTVFLGGFGVLNYVAERKQEYSELHKKLNTTADQLAAGLTIPIWNIDHAQIGKVIESAMQDPNIHLIQVNFADETYLRRRGPNGEILYSFDPKPVPDLIRESRTISFAGEIIGSVEVVFTPELIEKDLRLSGQQYALMVLLVDIAQLICLYLILWWIVLKPLRQVERYAVAVSKGPGASGLLRDVAFHGELENLRSSIEKMVHLLEARISEIQESEERYRTVFSVEPDTLLIIDLSTFEILDANEAATAMYGYSREELLSLSALALSGDVDDMRRALADVAPGRFLAFSRRQQRRKDGSHFPADIAARSFLLRGSVTIVVAIRDVSDRVRTEKVLYSAKEKAESADRVKSEFLNIAAHELKTPLTPLTLLLQMARSKLQEGQSIPAEIWDRMSLQVDRLTALVRDLLDVSRLERGSFPINPQRIELNQLVSRCVQDFRDQARNRSIRFEASQEPIEVEADPTRIYEVVANLIDNALKYSPDESPIEARIAALPGGHVRVSVTDHGQGIAPEQSEALFSRFFRVSSDATRRHPGLGLGLYICRRILELHHGRIAVNSEVGKGSTFYFELPKEAA